MALTIVLARPKDGEGNDCQRKQRQKVDGAPRSPHPDRMDEERGSGDQNHEQRPGPADRPVRQRPLWGQKLHGAEADRRKGESGVKPNDRRGVEQRGERHHVILTAGSSAPVGRKAKRASP